MSDHRREYMGKQRKALRGFLDYDLAMLQDMADTLVEQCDNDIATYMQEQIERLTYKVAELEKTT
jgi:hypothetical protein